MQDESCPESGKETLRFKSVQQLYAYIEKEARRRVRRLIEETGG